VTFTSFEFSKLCRLPPDTRSTPTAAMAVVSFSLVASIRCIVSAFGIKTAQRYGDALMFQEALWLLSSGSRNIAQSRAAKELKEDGNPCFVQLSISWPISHTYITNARLDLWYENHVTVHGLCVCVLTLMGFVSWVRVFVLFTLKIRAANGDRGGTAVKVLCYKSEGSWFHPSWCH
jgi:hypothetical protein